MLNDVKVYDGQNGTWFQTHLKADNYLDLVLRSRRAPEWCCFRFEGKTFYRTFEDHIYLVVPCA
jgi:hypothetical protein